MTREVDISPVHREIVEGVLRERLPEDVKVWVFGSRADWTTKDSSDLDLALEGESKLSAEVLGRLKDAFEDSELPYTVDVVDLHQVEDPFKQIIESQRVRFKGSALFFRQTPNRRRVYRIGDIADVVGGSTPSTKDERNFGGEIPWVTPKDLSGNPSRYVSHGNRYLTQVGLDSCSAKIVPIDSVILSTRAPIGYVAIAESEIVTNQGIRSLIVRDHDLADPEFIYYWLSANVDELKRHASGSTFSELSGKSLKSIEIDLPSIGEQRRIAQILGALDDKIELNRQMSKTLEDMAHARFKSWFIDFDPVRAKSEGRATGLPPDLDALFPDRFVDSELGLIPDGWQIQRFGEMITTVRGRSYRSSELASSKIALVTLKSFKRGGGYRSDGLKPFIGTFKPEQVVYPGEVVLSCTDVTQDADVIGRPAIVQTTGAFCKLVASLDVLIVRPIESKINRSFMYLLMSTRPFVSHTLAHTTGTTVLHLDRGSVLSFSFACPSVDIIQFFDNMIRPMLVQIQRNEREGEILSSLQDTLLSPMLSQTIFV